jgi:uncharacterized protein (DUF736 family)
MVIGKFYHNDDGSYVGNVGGFSFPSHDPVRLTPSKKGAGPDYIIIDETDGEAFEIGAAWSKTSKAGNPYLSVKLDGPTLAAPINCALTKQEDGSFALLWNRESRKEQDTAA